MLSLGQQGWRETIGNLPKKQRENTLKKNKRRTWTIPKNKKKWPVYTRPRDLWGAVVYYQFAEEMEHVKVKLRKVKAKCSLRLSHFFFPVSDRQSFCHLHLPGITSHTTRNHCCECESQSIESQRYNADCAWVQSSPHTTETACSVQCVRWGRAASCPVGSKRHVVCVSKSFSNKTVVINSLIFKGKRVTSAAIGCLGVYWERVPVFACIEDSQGLELGSEGPRLQLPTDSAESEGRGRMRPPGWFRSNTSDLSSLQWLSMTKNRMCVRCR